MSFNLRAAVLENVSGNNEEQVEATIQDAVESGEEKMLPGLGVLFEVFWKQASDQEKDQVIRDITDGLQ
ncbi:small acid-soluble spore protein SspI [Salibacterium halotolerans]|uniref:Small, acid-soluble spore protein I n=1 Tax=Salibacterium halotolerans TaxID=1884432 RepID=A0A1I5SM97_9BACI|nr:small acid-soluble spore protein SspI [Salibacterium halotolerans]SFP71838.1 small acid-soluble spore protein I (minor) [Salibacterium halotolerans]